MNAKATYKILAIDGGGLRGIIPHSIMERLDNASSGWRQDINMFAGTSTGGLISLCMAHCMSPSELLNVHADKGPSIFARSLWQEVKSLNDVTGPKYDSTNREQVCKEVLGNISLGDLRSKDGSKGHVVITSFD